MAENPPLGEGSLTNFVGRSKKELYDIMCNIKALIDQDEAQMRQVFIQNPELTKALFQGIQAITSRLLQQANVKATHSFLEQSGLHDQSVAVKASTSSGRRQNLRMMQTSSYAAATTMDVQSSQFLPSHALQSLKQPKAHVYTEATPQPLQVVNEPTPILPYSASLPPPPLQRPTSLPPPALQSPMASTRSPLYPTSGISRQPLQAPLPPRPIPYSMFAFPSQFNPQMGQDAGFQRSVSPQLRHSHSSFHPVARPPISIGLPFPSEQQPISVQPLPESLYHQARGSHVGGEFKILGESSSMQHERGPVQMPSFPRTAMPTQLPSGRPPFATGQGRYSYQPPPPPPPMNPELERSLIQQVLALTPQEIGLLSPEQRNQVLYLQRVLRQ